MTATKYRGSAARASAYGRATEKGSDQLHAGALMARSITQKGRNRRVATQGRGPLQRLADVTRAVIDRVEVVTRGDVRRAKLYYLRDRIGKAAKIKEKRV